MTGKQDVVFHSVRELAAGIRSGQFSSLEAVKAHLEHIGIINSKLNAVVQLAPEAALKRASEADARLARKQPTGPLHGVPFTVKDSIDAAGLRTTAGTLGRAFFEAAQDAPAVARLRAAGGIPLGKTNVPELTFGFETDNLLFGRTNNPYDLRRSPGGSCGGEAALIAAGGSPLGLGSDLGGSLRFPAHFCGIASLKPTCGRIPRAGHFPPSGGVLDSLWHFGPLARFVEDLSLALPILSGEDWQDPTAAPVPIRPPGEIPLRSLRVAYYADNGLRSPENDVAAVIENAAQALALECAAVENARPPALDAAFELPWKLFAADEGEGMKSLLNATGSGKIHPLLQAGVESLRGKRLTIEVFNQAAFQLDQVRAAMWRFFQDFDVIICPVCPIAAFPHGASLKPDAALDFSYTVPYNVTGWPVVAVRAGTSAEGLPIGIQVISRPWREDVGLAVALFVEHEFGGWQRPSL